MYPQFHIILTLYCLLIRLGFWPYLQYSLQIYQINHCCALLMRISLFGHQIPALFCPTLFFAAFSNQCWHFSSLALHWRQQCALWNNCDSLQPSPEAECTKFCFILTASYFAVIAFSHMKMIHWREYSKNDLFPWNCPWDQNGIATLSPFLLYHVCCPREYETCECEKKCRYCDGIWSGSTTRGGRCSFFLMMRCFNDAMFYNS